MVKDWNRSRTIILNGALSLVSLVSLLAALFAGPDMAALGIPPEIVRGAAIAGLIAGVLNTWLRAVTTMPIRLPGESVASAQERAP